MGETEGPSKEEMGVESNEEKLQQARQQSRFSEFARIAAEMKEAGEPFEFTENDLSYCEEEARRLRKEARWIQLDKLALNLEKAVGDRDLPAREGLRLSPSDLENIEEARRKRDKEKDKTKEAR